jgi:hypothetical protein
VQREPGLALALLQLDQMPAFEQALEDVVDVLTPMVLDANGE